MLTYREALAVAVERLCSAKVPSPEWDARMLLAHVVGTGHMDIPLDEDAVQAETFFNLIARRATREPLQHITGLAPFGPLDLEVGPGVFIPRPETESLADWAVGKLRGLCSPTVVDLCAGSGALAAYIKHYCPQAKIYAVELSDAALAYTRRNLEGTDVKIVQGDVCAPDILAGLDGSVDLIVSNPPYVPEDSDPDNPSLEPEVYFDPHMAVFSGKTGMDLIPRMLGGIDKLLKPGGYVGIEHDDSTSDATQEAMRGAGFAEVSVLCDLAGVARFVTARKPITTLTS
ncbi:MAG: peptide chain release factor N(5)-glutamine methyltransferase [Corynebacterium sp.]|nr:peptide chain release factor N(5)-glutamine methyltransferase [Corynebacterium sp.]